MAGERKVRRRQALIGKGQPGCRSNRSATVIMDVMERYVRIHMALYGQVHDGALSPYRRLHEAFVQTGYGRAHFCVGSFLYHGEDRATDTETGFLIRRLDMAIFKGAGVAIVTPMHEDDSVNFEKLYEIIDEQIAGGTDAIIICGTTGESATLTVQEHLEVIKACIDHVDHRVPVIAGTGSNCTRDAVAMSKEAESCGADGLLCVTPYYNKATQKGLIAHYTAISEAVNIPIIVYNVPSRTGCNIQPETIAYLAEHTKNIRAVKEASGSISQIAKLKALCGDAIDIYSGNDDQIVPILSVGGLGVISVLSNVAPRQTHEICQAWFDGDVKKAAKLQLEAIDLIEALFCEVNPIPVKTAMNLMGKEVGPLRMPMCEMEPKNVERLKKAMENYGIL